MNRKHPSDYDYSEKVRASLFRCDIVSAASKFCYMVLVAPSPQMELCCWCVNEAWYLATIRHLKRDIKPLSILWPWNAEGRRVGQNYWPCHGVPCRDNREQVSLHMWRYLIREHCLYVHIEVSRLKKKKKKKEHRVPGDPWRRGRSARPAHRFYHHF